MLRWYELRWRIERFFHAPKTGTRIEDRHLDQAADPEKCLAFDAITAFRVRDLSELARGRPACRRGGYQGTQCPGLPSWLQGPRAAIGGPAGFHPTKRQPLPGTQKLREGVKYLSHAVTGIRAMQERDRREQKGEDAESSVTG